MAGRRTNRRMSATRYLRGSSMGRRSLNWVTIAITAAVALALIAGGILLFLKLRNPSNGEPALVSQTQSGATLDATPTLSSASTTPDVPAGSSEQYPLDLSQDAEKVVAPGNSINIPCIYENDMVFSAGSGSVDDTAILTKLYQYNLVNGGDAELLYESTIKNGEIFDTLINGEYVVWLDTNQDGKSQIYFLKRHDEEGLGISMIKECEHAMPKLRLSKDSLIFTEQYVDPDTKEREEMLYHVDLISGENVALPNYTESILGQETTYAVSAPDIYGDEVIWAAPDPSQSEEERLAGEKSVIYSCNLEQLKNDDYQPQMWSAGMYVHEPITNGKAWAWIDKNKAWDSTLWVKYQDQVINVSTEVVSYCFGDSMLVYNKDGAIWVYFYETGKYGRITKPDERGILPVATGRKVVWYDRTESELEARGGKDQLMIVYIP